MSFKNSSILFINALVERTPSEILEEMNAHGKRKNGSMWCLDETLSAADLYIWLKAKFGKPNGITMLARRNSTDNFIQWHYSLKSGSSNVEIIGLNTRTEIWISDHQNLDNEDFHSVIGAIKQDFKKLGSKLKEIRSGLETWKIFYNPYFRVTQIVEKYTEELKAIAITDMTLPEMPSARPKIGPLNESDLRDYERKLNSVRNKYIRAQELSLSLRMLSPVWGESFVNIIIFLLANEDLKSDIRVYNDVFRKAIDIRLRTLHSNCIGFSTKIDPNSSEFKNFHTLMNARNDLLHGNINVNQMTYETILFDDTIPLFKEHSDLGQVGLGNSLKGIEIEETLKNIKIVEALIEYILNLLESDIRPEIERVLGERDLGWREEKKRVGVLFGRFSIEGFAR